MIFSLSKTDMWLKHIQNNTQKMIHKWTRIGVQKRWKKKKKQLIEVKIPKVKNIVTKFKIMC